MPFIAPQSVWPQTIICGTFSTPAAYSIVAETPPEPRHTVARYSLRCGR